MGCDSASQHGGAERNRGAAQSRARGAAAHAEEQEEGDGHGVETERTDKQMTLEPGERVYPRRAD